jgi:hypothetical protein
MAELQINASTLGNQLENLLMAEDIIPGDEPSYQLCKIIWLWHPLGKKMVESPIIHAQSQAREISIPGSPEDKVRDQFNKTWEDIRANEIIYNAASLARAYGVGSVAAVAEDMDYSKPLTPEQIVGSDIRFSIFDPLNTAGSLVLNQNPLAVDFMKPNAIRVSSVNFHRSRTVTLLHEQPVYIAYTIAAFGFVGRSVFQRALYPLKSFVQTMITDDLVTKKAGVFVARLGTAGAIIDNIMQTMAGLKRMFIKVATIGNVISVGKDEFIETLNMQNLDAAFGMARRDILENIAAAADMPAKLLLQESFAEGFGEGAEDAKAVAAYIDGIRVWLRPLYAFFDRIVMYKAWTPEFYQTIQQQFPDEWGKVPYEQAFFAWANAFTAKWPSLLTEPESEQVVTDNVKIQALLAFLELFMQLPDPENLGHVMQWVQDNINQNRMMFQTPLQLNIESIMQSAAQMQEQQAQMAQAQLESGKEQGGERKDSDEGRGRRRRIDLSRVHAAAKDLVDMMHEKAGKKQPPRIMGTPPPKLNGANGRLHS